MYVQRAYSWNFLLYASSEIEPKIVSYAKHRISEGLQGFAVNSPSRKDLPICGSQFETGYKSE